MKKKLNKDEILTIPNGLSFLRLLLTSLIVWLYCGGGEEYGATTAVIAVFALTDIIDGKIARKFNMVSDVGKVLDPIADKLTQAALVICLLSRYPWMGALLILFMDIPELGVKILTALCGAVMVLSLAMYGHFYHASLVQAPSDSGLKKALTIGRKAVFALICVGMITLCIVHCKNLTAEEIASFTPKNPWFAASFDYLSHYGHEHSEYLLTGFFNFRVCGGCICPADHDYLFFLPKEKNPIGRLLKRYLASRGVSL